MKDFLQTIIVGGVFVLPFVVLIVLNDMFFPYITGKNFAFRILVEIIFGAWVLLALLDARFRPRWSWIVGSFGALIVVLLFSNGLGKHPETSFWSNFERMEGYVTIIHLFLYMMVAASVLRTQQLWSWFWHISLVAAAFVAIDGLAEYAENGGRIAGLLGNPAYLAIYMLFHVFVTLYLFVRETQWAARAGYAFLGLLFAYVLIQTGTRGTAIGLVAGLVTVLGYVAVFAQNNRQLRLYAAGMFGLLVLLVSGFVAVKDTEWVQTSPTLARIANIDLQEDLEVRMTIWKMALEGVQERPILGWGQSNFNFVFNEQYDPFLYDQEQWFDRVHNIFLDWLVAGGILGFIAYFGIFGATVYYLVRGQRVLPKEQQFTVLEQAVLVGLLAGYLTHNLVVFDNIVSYIFFGSVLAMVHARVGVPWSAVQQFTIRRDTVYHVVAPATVVLIGAVVYFVNIPSYQTSADVIRAMRAPTELQSIAHFETALERRGFGKQEVAEQMAQMALKVQQEPSIESANKERFMASAEEALVGQIQRKPGDARLHVFLGAFYRAADEPQAAKEQFARARELSPKKQSIIVQQGATELALENATSAREFFGEAFTLDTRNTQARVLYAATLFSTGEADQAKELLAEGGNAAKRMFAMDSYALSTANVARQDELLTELYQLRIENDPTQAQNWASLGFVYYRMGEIDQAIAILEKGKKEIPEFTSVANCYIDNLRSGEEPSMGCQ